MKQQKKRIYLTADDGRLYCLDLKTGEIVWWVHVEKFPGEGGTRLYTSKIEDGLLFVVATSELYAFSLDELQSSVYAMLRGVE